MSANRPALFWQSRVLGRSGYATNARDILKELSKRDVRLSFRHLIPEPENDPETLNSDWYRKITETSVVCGSCYLIFHTAAGNTGAGFFREARAMNPGHSRYIGYTMFESDRITPEWVHSMEAMDEIWVPSRFNLETFVRSGVPREKIRVMPLGVDPSRFDPGRANPMRPPTGKGFNFLSVFEWTARKGWDVLLRSYVEEFKASEDVSLTLVTYRGGGANWRSRFSLKERLERFLREECGVNPGEGPAIHLLEERIPDERWADLFAGHDAFVLPSRGEGWGLPYMEAMAMGLPVAATRWGGQMEFLSPEVAYFLEIDGLQKAPAEQIRDNPLFAGHSWANPTEKSTRQVMRRIFENRQEAREIGEKSRKHVLENYSIQKLVDRIESRVREIAPEASGSVEPSKASEPYRFLWVGSSPSEEGLNLLLSCYCASFEPNSPVHLTLASASPQADDRIRRTVEAFRQFRGAPMEFVATGRTAEERKKLFESCDAFVYPSSVEGASPFCLEAATAGIPLVVSEEALPEFLRSEACSFFVPGLEIPKGEGLDRRFLFKPYPNVLGWLLKWAADNPEAAREKGRTAKERVTGKRFSPPQPFPILRIEDVSGSPEQGGLAGALNRALRENRSEIIGITAGEKKASETFFRVLQADIRATMFFESSPEGAVLLVRPKKVRPFGEFDSFFEGAACLHELARLVSSQGGRVLLPVDFLSCSPFSQDASVAAIALMELSSKLAAAGKREEAIRSLARALEKQADYPEAIFGLARSLWERKGPGDEEKAEALLERLIELRPLHVRGRQLWGAICFSKGRADEAFEHLELMAQLESENPTAWNDLGVVRAARGEMKQALECLTRARSLDQNNLDALKNGADLLVALGEVASAVQWLQDAAARHPQDKEIQSRLDSLASAQGGGQ